MYDVNADSDHRGASVDRAAFFRIRVRRYRESYWEYDGTTEEGVADKCFSSSDKDCFTLSPERQVTFVL